MSHCRRNHASPTRDNSAEGNRGAELVAKEEEVNEKEEEEEEEEEEKGREDRIGVVLLLLG